MILFATAISPATVILVIAPGFNTSGVDPISVIVPLLIFCVSYSLVCLYCKPKFQMDITIVCTFLFSPLMFVVMVGYVINIVQDIKSFKAILSNYNEIGTQRIPAFVCSMWI